MTLKKPAETAIKQCLNVRPDEDVLIITDEKRMDIAEALYKQSVKTAENTVLTRIEETGQHGSEPPKTVSESMKNVDVVIAPTTYSLTHTNARIEACKSGARVATMPGITKRIFRNAMVADYDEIESRSRKIYEMLEETDKIRVTTPSGTDISVQVNMDYWEMDTGKIHKKGEFGNLPAGEVDGAPIKAEGKIVIDFLKAEGEVLAPEGTEVKVKNNKAVAISENCRLSEAFRNVKNASNIAELGVGTNSEAKLIGNILQDEKVMGTCHFAFGDNTSYGGGSSCEIHWDAILKQPTILFDGETVMEDGEFEVEV